MKKLIAVLFLLMAGPALAAEPPMKWYGGIGFGSNSNDSIKDDTQVWQDFMHAVCGNPACTSSGSADTSVTGVNLFAGYRFNDQLAVEGGYVNLGKFTGSTTTTGGGLSQVSSLSLKASALSVSAVGFLPVTADKQGALIGKIGLARWESDENLSSSGVLGPLSVSVSQSGTDPVIGVGYEHRFGGFGVRALYERYKADDEAVTRLSLSLVGYF